VSLGTSLLCVCVEGGGGVTIWPKYCSLVVFFKFVNQHRQLTVVVFKSAKYSKRLLTRANFFHHQFVNVDQNVRQNLVKISGHPPVTEERYTERTKLAANYVTHFLPIY
jgi:hypothetical protein